MKKRFLTYFAAIATLLLFAFALAVSSSAKTDTLYGDVNGDGSVTALDIVRLKKYFAEYDVDTGSSSVGIFPGADADGDGSVTALDIVRLKKYFAEYDPASGTSTVTLGPPPGDNDGWSIDVR